MAISDTYNSRTVLLQTTTASGGASLTMPKDQTQVDFSNNLQLIGHDWQKRESIKRNYFNRRIKQSYEFVSAYDAFEFLSFFEARKGRYEAFYLPLWLFAFTPCTAGTSTTALSILQSERRSFFSATGFTASQISRKNLLIVDNLLGTRNYREITGLANIGASTAKGYDTLTLDSAVTYTINSLITEVLLVRFATDELELSPVVGGNYQINLEFMELQGVET